VTQSASQPCWICGDPADSDEHKHKRSDLVARHGRSWTPEQQPFVIRGDGSSHWTRIQGPNDRNNLYEKMLCRPCNNARTKPFDQAYQEFSDWVLANATTLHGQEAIDFERIYGGDYAAKTLNLLRYFAKSLGCRIAAAGIDPPEALRCILTEMHRCDTLPLIVTFGIDEFWYRVDPTGRIIGADCFHTWPEITDRPCFSWTALLGYLEIFYWYDLEWEDGYPFGGEPMWEPRRLVSLGRRDPLPDEPAAFMTERRPIGDETL
jgi:hypothetical protein